MIFTLKERAEQSLYSFFIQAWPIIEGHSKFVDEWFLEVIAEHLELVYKREIKNLLINVPPRVGKTSLISIAFPAWVWIKDATEKIISASCTNSLSLDIADKSRLLIQSSWYQENWGHLFKIRIDQNSKSYFANDKLGYRISTSVGSSIIGRGGSIQICLTADTFIDTNKGSITIGEIVNDNLDVRVLSYNHELNITEYKQIKTYYKHEGKLIYRILIASCLEEKPFFITTLKCTEEHPIFVIGKGYIKAKEILVGDKCLFLSNNINEVTVRSIVLTDDNPDYVYNLEIKDNNNYFANNILVHNCDDPNVVGGESEVVRDSVNNWWSMKWYNRLNDIQNDRRILVQQRGDEKDVSGSVIANDINNEWVKLILPLEYESQCKRPTVPLFWTRGKPWEDKRTKDGELLTNRLTIDDVNKLKKELGSYGYAALYQQRPAPLDGGIIKKHWFKLYKWGLPQIDYVIQSWDTALTANDDSAYSACSTWGLFQDRYDNTNVILLSCWRGRLEYPELRERIKRLADNYMDVGEIVNKRLIFKKPDKIVIEAKASGEPLLQDLRRAGVYGQPFIPNKHGDKTQRVRLITPLIEAGVVWMPAQVNNPDRMEDFADEFVNEVSYFPNPRSLDYTDTLTQALIVLRDGSSIKNPKDYYEPDDMREETQAWYR